MADALVRLMLAYQRLHKEAKGHDVTALPLGEPELRWNQRFRPFLRLHSPPFIPHSYWLSALASMAGPRTVADMLRDAAEHLQMAKAGCEKLSKLLDDTVAAAGGGGGAKVKEPPSSPAAGKQPVVDARAPAIVLPLPVPLRDQLKTLTRVRVFSLNSLWCTH